MTEDEQARYEWQQSVASFGAAGQERLKASSVLVSRCGGVGGAVAYQLAAAGVGRLVLDHAGGLRADDLNRPLLMSQGGVGRPCVEVAARRLGALNPLVAVEAVPENVGEANAAGL